MTKYHPVRSMISPQCHVSLPMSKGDMSKVKMDSQSRLFESPVESGFSPATPMPCRRAMPRQALTAWTPAAVVGALFSAVLALPRALVLAPAVIRRRA